MTYKNPRVRVIQIQAIQRSNKPLNKYNTSLHMDTEELTGEPNDRTDSDVGIEKEIINNNE